MRLETSGSPKTSSACSSMLRTCGASSSSVSGRIRVIALLLYIAGAKLIEHNGCVIT
jgi:hypothetical protein